MIESVQELINILDLKEYKVTQTGSGSFRPVLHVRMDSAFQLNVVLFPFRIYKDFTNLQASSTSFFFNEML